MSKPLNINLLNIDEFIARHNCGRVTSTFVYESSSKEFSRNGLFSESIFGQIGSTDRLIKFGYIDLRTTIFHPIIYSNLISLKAFYGEIMARKSYAKFDETKCDFVRATEDDEDASTGYKFFMDYFPKLVLVKNSSISQNDKVNVITSTGNLAYMDKCLVMPAQIRDVDTSTTQLKSDAINNLYVSLINYSNALPMSGEISDIYDGIRFSIQKKVAEIYQYVFDMIENKFGFFQSKYGSRALALGTRNVISPSPLNAASPDNSQQLKIDELGVPLFQTAKACMPLFIYHSKTIFFNSIFSPTNDQVALIDPKTYDLVYKPISEDEKNKFISSEGIEKIVNLFRDREFRFRYLTCETEDGIPYYLFLVYDEGDRISITRSVTSLRNYLNRKHMIFDVKKLRPMTYAEFMYIVCRYATNGKHCTVTRYPAQEIGSTVPCKVHVMSTIPSRAVTLAVGDYEAELDMPEYPIINKNFADSISIHAGLCPGLGADFDRFVSVALSRNRHRITA